MKSRQDDLSSGFTVHTNKFLVSEESLLESISGLDSSSLLQLAFLWVSNPEFLLEIATSLQEKGVGVTYMGFILYQYLRLNDTYPQLISIFLLGVCACVCLYVCLNNMHSHQH